MWLGMNIRMNNLYLVTISQYYRAKEYDVRCSVKGGGLSGQAGAIILGISKALISHDELLKKMCHLLS